MRANSPTDNDLGLLNIPSDGPDPIQKLTKEHLELAKAAKGDGKIILNHLQRRLDVFTSQLKNIDLTSVDPVTALARTMAAQLVIKEFEQVMKDVNTAQKAVEDAARASRQSPV